MAVATPRRLVAGTGKDETAWPIVTSATEITPAAPRIMQAGSRCIGPPGSGLAAGTPAPGYFRMLTARATISATVTMETIDCKVMASFAQRDSGITSVGLNAAALVNAR